MTAVTSVTPESEAPRHQRGTRRPLIAAVLGVVLVAALWGAWVWLGRLDPTKGATNPIMRWEWLADPFNREEVKRRFVQHLQLTIVPVALGLLIASVLSAIAIRFRWLTAPVTTFAGALYMIPSLALFGILVGYNTNWTAAVIALTSYTLLILIRNIIAGIDAVPESAIDAANGLGMSRWQRFRHVELPLALPVILTGLRVATVTTVGLVSVSIVIQLGGLAYFIFDGYKRTYTTPIVVGTVLSISLAVILDLLLRGIEALATPWSRRAETR